MYFWPPAQLLDFAIGCAVAEAVRRRRQQQEALAWARRVVCVPTQAPSRLGSGDQEEDEQLLTGASRGVSRRADSYFYAPRAALVDLLAVLMLVIVLAFPSSGYRVGWEPLFDHGLIPLYVVVTYAATSRPEAEPPSLLERLLSHPAIVCLGSCAFPVFLFQSPLKNLFRALELPVQQGPGNFLFYAALLWLLSSLYSEHVETRLAAWLQKATAIDEEARKATDGGGQAREQSLMCRRGLLSFLLALVGGLLLAWLMPTRTRSTASDRGGRGGAILRAADPPGLCPANHSVPLLKPQRCCPECSRGASGCQADLWRACLHGTRPPWAKAYTDVERRAFTLVLQRPVSWEPPRAGRCGGVSGGKVAAVVEVGRPNAHRLFSYGWEELKAWGQRCCAPLPPFRWQVQAPPDLRLCVSPDLPPFRWQTRTLRVSLAAACTSGALELLPDEYIHSNTPVERVPIEEVTPSWSEARIGWRGGSSGVTSSGELRGRSGVTSCVSRLSVAVRHHPLTHDLS